MIPREKGDRFQPTDEELAEHYLKPKILDPDSDRHYIGDVKDLTQFEPSDLFRNTLKNPDDKEAYFFLWPTYKNGQISRKGKNGSWSETSRPVPIDSAGEQSVAEKRVFVFRRGFYRGPRTNWFIHQFELLTHQDKKKIFLCKLFERKVKQKDKVSGNKCKVQQKDKVSGHKRKVKHNVQGMSTKPKRGRTYNSSRKKAKVSSDKETQLNDEDNSHIMSCEVLHGSLSLPYDPDSSISIGELTPQSHHLPSKHFSENGSNILTGGYPLSTLHPSNDFPGDIQNINDNQQFHNLSSNFINSSSTYIGMQPNYHFLSSTLEGISNTEDLQYNFPLNPENDNIPSELSQRGHHLPSKKSVRMPPTILRGQFIIFPSTYRLQNTISQSTGKLTPVLNFRSYSGSTLHPSNGFLGDIQNISDNQQCHHLSSNSINSNSTYIEMQPNHHFSSSTSKGISNNEDPQHDFPSISENDIIPSELLQWGHHLPSKKFSENASNILTGGYPWSTLHPSNGFPSDIQNINDNQQFHNLSSNFINSSSTYVGMQPNYHFLSSTLEGISNTEDLQYNFPLDPESDSIPSELTQWGHHLPSKKFSENASNILMGGYPGSTLHPSNGFPGDIQNISDNQQCHHLSSNSINSGSTYIEMQPNHHFPSITSEGILNNEDPQYDFPSISENDIIPSELRQWVTNQNFQHWKLMA